VRLIHRHPHAGLAARARAALRTLWSKAMTANAPVSARTTA
jgi:hypothetical protein